MASIDKSILHLDGMAQAELIRKGEISPEELLTTSIEAIERLNPQLNAVITPMYEQARQSIAQGLPEGPFRGVPFLLKDLLAFYKGVRCANGSKLLMSYVADHDSTLTLRYKQAGLVILGRTNLPEFGILPTTEPEAFGPTHNPWNLAHTPGGSSGGSAAAVAARMVAMAHANDGGGSIRIPASCCGLFGLKPTRGRNPLGPSITELIGGLVMEHVLTRSVRDSALMLDCTAGPEPGDIYAAPAPERSFLEEAGRAPGRLRIAYSPGTPLGTPLSAEAQEAQKKALALLERLGHEIIEMPLPLSLPGEKIVELFVLIWATGATLPLGLVKQMMGFDPQPPMVEPLTRAMYEIAQKATATDLELARTALQGLVREIGRMFAKIDVWLSPTLAEPPVKLGEMAQNPQAPLAPFHRAAQFAPFTAIFNLTGQPAASLPLYWTESGLPLGIQIVGRFGDEATLIRLAAQLEQAQPWADKLPPVVV
ncbi:MAG: amidase [Microscillaceae bacterium]